MLQDLLQGRPTEIDFMSGHIVRKGTELSLPTPVNATMVAIVKDLEQHVKTSSPALLDVFDGVTSAAVAGNARQ